MEPKLQGVVAIPDWDWWIGTGFFYDDINAAFARLATVLGAITLVIAAALAAIAWGVLRSVRRTLGGGRDDADRHPHRRRRTGRCSSIRRTPRPAACSSRWAT